MLFLQVFPPSFFLNASIDVITWARSWNTCQNNKKNWSGLFLQSVFLHSVFLQSAFLQSIQGDQKMHHKDSELNFVLEVQFYFSTCVLESIFEFVSPRATLNITHSES